MDNIIIIDIIYSANTTILNYKTIQNYFQVGLEKQKQINYCGP